MRILLPILLLILGSLAEGAAKYVPADDSQPLIRRDLIPLDVDAIRELAQQLAILADGPTPASARLLRHRVQTLTLCQRLSPAQAQARAIIAALSSQSSAQRPAPPAEESAAATRSALSTASWLIKLPTDSEGHHLGQLLLDVLRPLAPKETVFENHDPQSAPQRWQQVVAKVAAFRKRKKAPVIAQDDPPPIEVPEKESLNYTHFSLSTEVPMITKGLDAHSLTTPGLIRTRLSISKNEDPTSNSQLLIHPESPFPAEQLEQQLRAFFQSIDQSLPLGHQLNIRTGKRRYLAANHDNLAAPLAMMLDAAISGRALRPHTYLFAKLHPDGSLHRPAQAWPLLLDLENLSTAAGTRLIVGAGMAEEFRALLVLNKAAFFTDYEVIEAPTFLAARELFYSDGKPAPGLTAAIADYQEVCEKALLKSNLQSFLSLAAVKNRLIRARNHSPLHLSTHALASQATRRPATFTRFMFAQELDRRLDILLRLKIAADGIGDREVKDAYKAARKQLDPLERLVERSEKTVLDEVRDITKQLNTIDRINTSINAYEKNLKRTQELINIEAELGVFQKKLRKIQPSPQAK